MASRFIHSFHLYDDRLLTDLFRLEFIEVTLINDLDFGNHVDPYEVLFVL